MKRLLPLLAAVFALSACSSNPDGSKTINAPSVAMIANDVNLVATGLQRSLVVAAATPNLNIPADTLNTAQAALSGLRMAAAAIAGAADTGAAQPLVVQVEGYVNAFVGAVASIPLLPPQAQAYLTAATVLLPVIEVAVNFAIPAPPPASAEAARAALTAPTP